MVQYITSQKKKLLIITDLFPQPDNPVYGIFVKHQVDALAKHYQVLVVSTYFPKRNNIWKELTDLYEIIHIDYSIWGNKFLMTIFPYFRYVITHLKKLYKEFQPDLIHIHDCRHLPELFLLRYWLNSLPNPTYLTLHNITTLPQKVIRFKYLYKKTLVKSLENWKHIFTVNFLLKKQILLIHPNLSVSVLGNAIPECSQRVIEKATKIYEFLTEKKLKIISVGTLRKEKGFDYLIKALVILKQKGYAVQMVIIGDGDEYQNLVKLSYNLNCEKEILWAGALENSIVRSLYNYFDVFVLSSYSETFGIVYLEAMYAGLPSIGVIGQGIDGIIIHEKTGLLVKPKNEQDIADKLEFIIQNPEKAKAIAKAGQVLVRKDFMMPRLIEKVIAVYEGK